MALNWVRSFSTKTYTLLSYSQFFCSFPREYNNWGFTVHELQLHGNTENSRCCRLNETTNQRFAIKSCFISAALTSTHWKGLTSQHKSQTNPECGCMVRTKTSWQFAMFINPEENDCWGLVCWCNGLGRSKNVWHVVKQKGKWRLSS